MDGAGQAKGCGRRGGQSKWGQIVSDEAGLVRSLDYILNCNGKPLRTFEQFWHIQALKCQRYSTKRMFNGTIGT